MVGTAFENGQYESCYKFEASIYELELKIPILECRLIFLYGEKAVQYRCLYIVNDECLTLAWAVKRNIYLMAFTRNFIF